MSRAQSKFLRFQIEQTDERSGGHFPVPRMRMRGMRVVESKQKKEKEGKPWKITSLLF